MSNSRVRQEKRANRRESKMRQDLRKQQKCCTYQFEKPRQPTTDKTV